jgi:hypothetical protein
MQQEYPRVIVGIGEWARENRGRVPTHGPGILMV